MKLRTLALAAAIAAVPLVGQAALIQGQLDITGNINLRGSTFSQTGNVDFDPEQGFANIASGDFSPVNTMFEGDATVFDLTDIQFASPGTIYEGGGFEFVATSFFGFDNEGDARGFRANGIIRALGFDDTPGMFSFSTQDDLTNVSFSSTTTVIPLPASVLMLLGALGGLAFIGKRRSA
jgi:hypothetical protein